MREQFILSDEALFAELNRMTDSFTDELFTCSREVNIIFPVSRLVVDPERFLEDAKEPMSKVGMGVVYTRTSHGDNLRRNISDAERNDLINRFYVPHHEKLTQAVKNELEIEGRCLIIDCHSFPSVPLPYELDKASKRPDICIGTDDYHTPVWLIKIVDTLFTLYGFKFKHNRPFSGTLVPLSYYHSNPAVCSVMIEVNRRLYMDEQLCIKSPAFDEVRQKINTILNMLNALFLDHREDARH